MKTTIEGLGCLGMRLLDIQEELRRVVDAQVTFRRIPSRATIELPGHVTIAAVLCIGDETWALECFRADDPDSSSWVATYDKRGCFLGEARRGNERCWKIFDEAEADYGRQADAEEANIAATRDEWEPE